MTRVLYFAAAAFVLFFAVQKVRRWMATDEEQIRAVVERMMDGVEDGSTRRVLAGIDADRYRDDTSGLRRHDLNQALLYVFFHQKKELRPELLDFELEVQPDSEPRRAEVRFHCKIEEELADGSRRPWWQFSGVGELEKIEGDWRFIETRAIDHTHRPR